MHNTAAMEFRQSSPVARRTSPRHSVQRQRSNSFPIIDALGCTTPEAQLILAESKAAVRKRQGRRNHSLDQDEVRPFDPRDHIQFLQQLAAIPTPQEQSAPFESRYTHSRMPSDATDLSTSTVVPPHDNGGPVRNISPTLGNYAATLAEFTKNQLKSIPTYQPDADSTSSLSPRSCPDLSFPTQMPRSPCASARRPVEKPRVIEIPPIRPPVKSQFSAWSSTDEDTDDESHDLPEHAVSVEDTFSNGSSHTPSVLGYYETSGSGNGSSFLFSSTPLEDQAELDSVKSFKFPDQSALPSPSPDQPEYDDYPSSCPPHPQLTSLSATSAPSFTSSSVSLSYFDCKRPTAITPHMKERVIAAVTPPHLRNKRLSAMSSWEGSALGSPHDVYVESHQRVTVDGMSFDMLRDMNVSTRLTPC
ncbi:uncharacterized protein yc1106_07933 [Curvularia clavata]|uniref:Uncharacterized protein n=1 Tax=Curvularia clavata TaxID=95742 RepID=A0A9Q8ZFT4_CURCL|nr:uncharacterized protein yc1106_07933 [Curvularia clavata]